MQCTAKSKQSGQQCKRHATPGHEVCVMHGSKSLSGFAHPNLKSGLYSKYLPARLSEDYEELLELGPRLFQIADEVSVITRLIADQLDRLDDGECSATWNQLQQLYNEMAAVGAIQNKSAADIAEFNTLFSRIGRIINHGSAQWRARDAAAKLIEQKRKLVDSERKHEMAQHRAMSLDRAMLFFTAVVATFRDGLDQFVEDPEARKKVLSHAKGALRRINDQ